MNLGALVTLLGIIAAGPDAGTRVSITFELATPDAKVVLIHGTDERTVAQFPIRIRFDTSQTWKLRATKPGYCTLSAPIDYTQPRVVIELHPGCYP